MNNTQYTLRAIPAKVDLALRKRAKKTGKSLNETAIEALAKGVGVTPDSSFSDLDWFIGKNSIDKKSFDEAQTWLDNLPRDM